MPDLATNVLHHGDNLDILRRYLPMSPSTFPNARVLLEGRGIRPVAGWAQLTAKAESVLATVRVPETLPLSN